METIIQLIFDINKVQKSKLLLLERTTLLKPLRAKLNMEVEKIKTNPSLALSNDEKLKIKEACRSIADRWWRYPYLTLQIDLGIDIHED